MPKRIDLVSLTVEEHKLILADVIRDVLSKHLNKAKADVDADTTLLKLKEAAQLLGVSLTTIHAWSKNGLIKKYRIGAQVRLKKEELLAALKSGAAIKFTRSINSKVD